MAREIGHNVILQEGVELGDKVSIGHNVVIEEGTRIGNSVRIANNSVIGRDSLLQDYSGIGNLVYVRPQAVLGRFSYVASHSKVNTNVLPYSVITGNPARLKGANVILVDRILGREKRDEMKEIFKLFHRGYKRPRLFDELAAIDSEISREITTFMQEYVAWQ